MVTIKDQFDVYLEKVYPFPLDDVQKREVRQAFFAGALVAATMLCHLSAELPEDEAMKSAGELMNELEVENKTRLAELNSDLSKNQQN